MPRLRLVDYPVPVDLAAYSAVIRKLTDALLQYPQVLSVAQVGSIAHPGISDLDLFVIFKNGASFRDDPRESLSKDDRYILIHHLFGCTETVFRDIERFTFFKTYNKLGGADLPVQKPPKDEAVIKRQLATEFILKYYITLTTGIDRGLIRVRDLLLHTKPIALDLEYMNLHDGPLIELVDELMHWRGTWFTNTPVAESIATWVSRMHSQLGKTLERELEDHPIQLPSEQVRLSRAISIEAGTWDLKKRGFSIPSWIAPESKSVRSIRNRFQRYHYSLPIESSTFQPSVAERFDFIGRSLAYNRRHLPAFIPTSFGMDVYSDYR